MDVQNHSSHLPYNNKQEESNHNISESIYDSNKCCDKVVSAADAVVMVANDVRDKLQISSSCVVSNSNSLPNGCNKALHEDVKNVEFPINGLTKCHSFERIGKKQHLSAKEDGVGDDDDQQQHTPPVEKAIGDDESDTSTLDTSSPRKELSATEEVSDEKLVQQSLSDDVAAANILYIAYESEKQMPDIMRLIQKDLSEPYSIYTYRYFIHNWPKLCFLAQDGDKCVGAIVCKLDVHKKHSRRGYIAMLAVHEMYRKRKIGSNLVLKAIKAMVQDNADEVVLETEITNKPALRLYENLGFVRDKRLFRYYLNGVDALRLKLWLR